MNIKEWHTQQIQKIKSKKRVKSLLIILNVVVYIYIIYLLLKWAGVGF